VLFAVQHLSSRIGSMEQQLSDQLASGQQQLSQQMTHEITPPPAAPSISESCAAAVTSEGSYLGYYTCTATSTAQGTIEWKLDGNVVKTGSTVTIPVPHHHHQIQAVLVTSAGTFSSAPETVNS
jgi:hypothetical protein